MLPNHSPLTIAEQFGTLDDAAPRPHRPRPRPGARQRPDHDARAAPRPAVGRRASPQDVLELQGYLAGETRVPGVRRHPRARAPTCRCTSSARRCSARSSPRRSACPTRSPRTSRPRRCTQAVAAYRAEFRPSEQLDAPYVHRRRQRRSRPTTPTRRSDQLAHRRRRRVRRCLRRPRPTELTDAQVDAFLASPDGRQLADMMRYTAVGTPADGPAVPRRSSPSHADADELIVAHHAENIAARLTSVELTASALGIAMQDAR